MYLKLKFLFKVKAVGVLDAVRSMQDEIRELNKRIREESEAIDAGEAAVAAAAPRLGGIDLEDDDEEDDQDVVRKLNKKFKILNSKFIE